MCARTGVLLTATVAVLFAGDAAAQIPNQAPSGNYVAFAAGVDVVSADGVVAVEYGERVTPNVEAYASFTYFDNVMSKSMTRDLDALGEQLTSLTGNQWTFTGRDRALSFVGGARYLARITENVRLYAGAGAGALNLERQITAAPVGDVRLAVLNDYGIGSEKLTGEGVTRPVVEASGGLVLTPTRRVRLDFGCKVHKGFGFGQSIVFAQASGGIGYRF